LVSVKGQITEGKGQFAEALARLEFLSQQLVRLVSAVDELNTTTAKLWVVTCGDGEGLVARVSELEERVFADDKSIMARLTRVEQGVRRIERILEMVLSALVVTVITALMSLILK